MSTPDTASDEVLMQRFAAGDAEAFDVLLARHRRGVYGVLLRSVRNRAEADDLFQEVFMKLVRSAPRWRPQARFTTWLYTIVRNTCIDAARRRGRAQLLPLDDGDPDTPTREPADRRASPLEQVVGGELSQVLEQAIAALPEEQRETLLLKRRGLRFHEVAEITGVPTGTAKSRMRYALQALRRTLEERGLLVSS